MKPRKTYSPCSKSRRHVGYEKDCCRFHNRGDSLPRGRFFRELVFLLLSCPAGSILYSSESRLCRIDRMITLVHKQIGHWLASYLRTSPTDRDRSDSYIIEFIIFLIWASNIVLPGLNVLCSCFVVYVLWNSYAFPRGEGGARRSLMTTLLAFREIIPQSALTAIQNSVLTLNLGKRVYNIRRVTRIS